MWTFRGSQQLGLKQLDYTEYNGAALLSVGFEGVFKVWNIKDSQTFGTSTEVELNLDTGLLPVAGARFLGSSYYVFSVDVKGQVKIWNYKTGSLFQVVNQDQKLNSLVNGVVSLSAIRFAVLTRKLTFYNLPVIPDIVQNLDYKH